MAIHGIRYLNGACGIPPVQQGIAKAAMPVNALVYRNVSDGKLTLVATNGTKCIGVTASAPAADGDVMSYTPLYPGMQVLMDFDGTYAITKLGVYCEVTVTGGVPVANLNETINDILKLEELVSNTTDVKRAWFSVATTANQNVIEVA